MDDMIDGHPPGTLRLQEMLDRGRGKMILHPVPTTDPNDPLNWPKWYKALNFTLVCYYTLMVFVNLDIGTVIWTDLKVDLGIPYETAYISFGVNCAGLAVGCVSFIPFALKFGRRPIYLITILVSLATAIWQAKMKTSGDLIGSNLVSGLAGAVSETICQMTIADMFFLHQRASANAMYLVAVNVGTFLAPVAAGYSAASQGWRWIWWWTTILFTICFVLFLFLYEDTKYVPVHQARPVLEQQVTEDVPDSSNKGKDRKTLQIQATTSSRASDDSMPRKSYLQRLSLFTSSPGNFYRLLRHTYQPFIILFTFPAITYTALMWGSILAWFSVAVSVYSVYLTLPPYNFGSAGVGLMNLAPFIGGVMGSIYGGFVSDRSIIWLSRRNKGIFEPEMRLWTAIPVIIIMPLSLLLFGLSIAYGLPWITPAVGLGLFGFATIALGDVAITYAMDCYTDIIGDAFVGVVFVRNVSATIIATTLTPWINGVGLINVFVISAVVAFALSMLTIPMMIWGKKSRVWTKDRLEQMAAKQFNTRG